MVQDCYTLLVPPRRDTATIFASPHSGRNYASAFVAQSLLDLRTLRSSEDAFVDMLYAAAPEHGAPLLLAETPRAFVDLNRAPEELDPALIEGVSSRVLNPRIASGLGVIPRVVAGGRVIQSGKISKTAAEDRLSRYWHPYHGALQTLIRESRSKFGTALLIDCHSMPHEAIAAHAGLGRKPPEVVLGDRHGASCNRHIMDQVHDAFEKAGFLVTRNTPFSGAYICQAYGRPSASQHVIQVEIDRSLYMHESRLQPSAGFEEVKRRLTAVIADLARIGRGGGRGQTLAAE